MKRALYTILITIILLSPPFIGDLSAVSTLPGEGEAGGTRPIIDLGYQYPDGILSKSPDFQGPQQVSKGDIDGNGVPDLVITGQTGLVYGSKRYVGVFFDVTLSAVNNKSFAAADFKAISPRPHPWSGDVVKTHQMQWLTVADLNGDGYDDIAFSMPTIYLGRDPSGVEYRDDRGQVYVVLGKTRSALGSVLDLSIKAPDMTLVGQDYGDRAGFSLGSGDINGDGRNDLLIGAPTADGPGNAYLDGGEIYSLTNIDFSRPQRFMILNESTVSVYIHGEAGQQYGKAITSGNLNGDVVPGTTRPLDDIIAAPFVAPNKPVKMVFGSPSLSGIKRLATQADWTSAYNVVHRAPNMITGDLNNDGIDDLIVGDAASGNFITYGSRTSIATVANARIIDSLNPGNFLGYSSAVADFDGDKLNDLAIMAASAIGQTNQYSIPVGEIHIVWGIPEGLTGTIDLKLEPTHFSLYGNDGTGPTGLRSNCQGHWNSRYGYTHGQDLNSDGAAELFFGGNWNEPGSTYIYKVSR